MSQASESNQYQMIDEAEQFPFVAAISFRVCLLLQTGVYLLDERRIIHALLVFKLLFQLLVCLFDALEGIIETDMKVDILHQLTDFQQTTDAFIKYPFVNGSPESQQVVCDGLQVCDVSAFAFCGLLDQTEGELHIGKRLAFDLLAQDYGIVVGRNQLGEE